MVYISNESLTHNRNSACWNCMANLQLPFISYVWSPGGVGGMDWFDVSMWVYVLGGGEQKSVDRSTKFQVVVAPHPQTTLTFRVNPWTMNPHWFRARGLACPGPPLAPLGSCWLKGHVGVSIQPSPPIGTPWNPPTQVPSQPPCASHPRDHPRGPK